MVLNQLPNQTIMLQTGMKIISPMKPMDPTRQTTHLQIANQIKLTDPILQIANQIKLMDQILRPTHI